jgi:hypothetical protein
MTKFNRYDGCEDANTSVIMPKDILEARSQRLSIGELIGHYETFLNEPTGGSAMYPWATRFAMGYPLPSWQRPLVWAPDQKVRFILSIWEGVDLGSYLVNDQWEYVEEADRAPYFRELSEVLLDGQQRLTALEEYITNRFAVPDGAGQLRYWREVPRIERRRFCSITLTKATITSWDEALLRKAYDLRAFGGTAHTEDQRADVAGATLTPEPSPDHTKNVRKWLSAVEQVYGDDLAIEISLGGSGSITTPEQTAYFSTPDHALTLGPDSTAV